MKYLVKELRNITTTFSFMDNQAFNEKNEGKQAI